MTGHGLGGVFLGGLGLPAHSEEHVPSPNPGKGDADLADTDRGGGRPSGQVPLGPLPQASKQASKQQRGRPSGQGACTQTPGKQASKQAREVERSVTQCTTRPKPTHYVRLCPKWCLQDGEAGTTPSPRASGSGMLFGMVPSSPSAPRASSFSAANRKTETPDRLHWLLRF